MHSSGHTDMSVSSEANIRKLFDSFDGKEVLIIGDVMIDAYIWGRVDRISPEAPVPVVEVQKRENRPGGAANVALNIRNLGGIPILCSVTGHDEKGDQLNVILQNQNLSTEGIIQSNNRKTTVKFRVIGNNAQMLRVDEESNHPLNDEETVLLTERIKQIILHKNIAAIVFEDYDKGIITPELIARVVDMARMRHIPVAVDPKKNNFLNYHHVDLFKPNLKELREGLNFGAGHSGLQELKEASRMLQDNHHINIIMVTLSEKGIFLCHKTEAGKYDDIMVPAHLRSVADVSGAGDTVIATAAICMACKVPPRQMATLCNLAGGLVCEHIGVVPIDKNLLLDEALKHLK